MTPMRLVATSTLPRSGDRVRRDPGTPPGKVIWCDGPDFVRVHWATGDWSWEAAHLLTILERAR